MLIRLFAITTCSLLALALPAMAATYNQYPGYSREGRDGRPDNRQHFQQLRRDLDLSREQTRQIRTILGERREQMEPLRERCRSDRTAMREHMRRGDFRGEELRQLAHRQADCRVDRQVLRHSTHERIAGVLTPEQRTRWEQQRQERHDQFPGRGNHRGWGAQRKFE